MQVDALGVIPREFTELVERVLSEFFERIKLKPRYIEVYIYVNPALSSNHRFY